jgi:O-antigen/teichoic acid export membrane protein
MAIAATSANAENLPVRPVLALTTRIATIGDQILVALTNFSLTLAIGRSFAASDLAAYGIGLSVALMVQALQRHTFIIPLMLRPRMLGAGQAAAAMTAQIIVLGFAIAGGSLALLGGALSGLPPYAMLVVASSLVCLVVQVQLEFSRAFLVKSGRPTLLFASACWYAAVSGLLAFAALGGQIEYATLLAVLGAAMLLHMAAIILLVRRVSPRRGLMLLRADVRRYGGWSLTATTTYAGYNHLPLLLLGVMASPVHAAAFVATRSLMQPVQILLRGLDIADKSGFAKRAGTPQKQAAYLFTLKLALLYAVAAGLIGTAIAVFADPLMALAYGSKFSGATPGLIAWAPVYVMISISLPFESLVYARREFRSYFLIRGVASVAAVALAVPLIGHFQAVGAIAACGVGWLIATTGTVVVLWRKASP